MSGNDNNNVPELDPHNNHQDFFFQAEDGIRDRNVTGVQTCALPISRGLDDADGGGGAGDGGAAAGGEQLQDEGQEAGLVAVEEVDAQHVGGLAGQEGELAADAHVGGGGMGGAAGAGGGGGGGGLVADADLAGAGGVEGDGQIDEAVGLAHDDI